MRNLQKKNQNKKLKKLSEIEKDLIEKSTDKILSFLKEKNVDYSSFEDELKNTITQSISASVMMSQMFIAILQELLL